MNGPTAAHFIEETHTPNCFAYTTFSTGSSSLPSPIGVTYEELPGRQAAARRLLSYCGVPKGARLFICYPPLASLFTASVLQEWGLRVDFLHRPNRDQLMQTLLEPGPLWLIGESSFLRLTLESLINLGLSDQLNQRLHLMAAGTPLDPELPEVASTLGLELHDLYGCQEFGWLAADGVPMRDDLRLLPIPGEVGRQLLAVGGLVVGDTFPLGHHPLNPEGRLVTPGCASCKELYETRIMAAPVQDGVTLFWLVRSILRLKARMVRVAPHVQLNSPYTVLAIENSESGATQLLEGPGSTELFDTLLAAQINYQGRGKYSQSWKAQGMERRNR